MHRRRLLHSLRRHSPQGSAGRPQPYPSRPWLPSDKGRRTGTRRSSRLCSPPGRGLCLRTGPGRPRPVGKSVGSSPGRSCTGGEKSASWLSLYLKTGPHTQRQWHLYNKKNTSHIDLNGFKRNHVHTVVFGGCKGQFVKTFFKFILQSFQTLIALELILTLS